jgi:hypothetical protein
MIALADAAALLDLIAARAPGLRDAGVVGRVELGDVAFTLAPAESATPAAAPDISSDDDAPTDALNDPATHGMFGDDAKRRLPRRTRTPLVPGFDE